ncbi:MAG: CDP-alcohol phosphatidyltransferase family protein [Aquisalimonadaceae bacterium]
MQPRPSRYKALLSGAIADLLAGLALLTALALSLWRLADTPAAVVGQALLVYAVIAWLVFVGRGRAALGAANRITLLRAVVAAVFAGLIFHAEAVSTHAWWLVGGASVALLLDGMDGWVARHFSASSAFGARFDMEVDAFFIMVLAALVFEFDKAGPWVLLIGLMRYGFVLLGWWLPALRGDLPASMRRKTVCVLQSVVLVAALAPIVGPRLATSLLGAALLLLCYSFVVDSIWLLRHPSPEGEKTHENAAR